MEFKTNPTAVGTEVVLTRMFNAPRELVYRAWTDPELLARWWGPKDFTNPVCEVDARPGGKIRIDMTGPDGTAYPMGGEFVEVDPPGRLVFTSSAFEDENGEPGLEDHNTVTFEAVEGSKTLVTLTAVVTVARPEFYEALSGMEEGWSQSFDRLDDLVSQR